jgi:hypothetical protein
MVRRKNEMMNPNAAAPPSVRYDMPLKCAWCGDVRGLEGSWRTPSNWDPRESGFSHGICPRCFRREKAALKKKR